MENFTTKDLAHMVKVLSRTKGLIKNYKDRMETEYAIAALTKEIEKRTEEKAQ